MSDSQVASSYHSTALKDAEIGNNFNQNIKSENIKFAHSWLIAFKMQTIRLIPWNITVSNYCGIENNIFEIKYISVCFLVCPEGFRANGHNYKMVSHLVGQLHFLLLSRLLCIYVYQMVLGSGGLVVLCLTFSFWNFFFTLTSWLMCVFLSF